MPRGESELDDVRNRCVLSIKEIKYLISLGMNLENISSFAWFCEYGDAMLCGIKPCEKEDEKFIFTIDTQDITNYIQKTWPEENLVIETKGLEYYIYLKGKGICKKNTILLNGLYEFLIECLKTL